MIAGLLALLSGAAVGYFALRPLPRQTTIEPEPGPMRGDIDSAAGVTPGTGADGTKPAPQSQVVLDAPEPNALAVNPLWVVGRARGTWYFEAEFPVRLLDANGVQLTWGSARANGEWMTTDFVPFALLLNFATPSTGTGTLVLERSNPSGLPQNAGEVRIPVRFR